MRSLSLVVALLWSLAAPAAVPTASPRSVERRGSRRAKRPVARPKKAVAFRTLLRPPTIASKVVWPRVPTVAEAVLLAQASLQAAGASTSDAAPKSATPPPASAIPEANERVITALETVITATRSPRARSEVTSNVTVLTEEQLERNPGVRVDDILRSIPSFQTFRRTSSVAADPTAQGVNLRNVGPSGVSRAVVLMDGVPVTDPFGGWVYWRAVPRLSLERVEIVPGASSALYGSSALGGAVQLLSRSITGPSFDLDAIAGLRYSYDIAARAANRWGPVGASLDLAHFQTRGYPVVLPASRGPVDGPAPSANDSITGRVEYAVSPDLKLDARGQYFNENQSAGTQFGNARVRVGGGAAGASYHLPGGGDLLLKLWGQVQQFDQNRARLFPPGTRNNVAWAAHQENTSNNQGLSLTWVPKIIDLGGRHLPAIGLDASRVQGRAFEDVFPPAPVSPTAIVQRDTRGTQHLLGLFAQDSYQPIPTVEVLAGVRADGWMNLNARRDALQSDGTPVTDPFPAKNEFAVSPRLGVRWQMIRALTARASGYMAFRAPNLNELYRPFQVGTVLTASNPALGPERLRGAEASLELAFPFGATLKAAGFYNFLQDPIVNATLAAPLADGSTRQRQNLGSVQILGAEGSLDVALFNAVSAQVAYMFAPTQVLGAASAAVVGKQLPHAPVRRATMAVSYDNPEIVTASVQVRYIGQSFEDDLNTLSLPAAWVVDANVRRRLHGGIEAYVTVNNLLNAEYLVGRAGVDTVAEPFTILGGVRFRFPQ